MIEYRNPGLEIINFSLPGFGTDQQLLMFEEIGSKYEHDLVILLPFLSNIRRNLAATVTWRDPKTGHLIVQAKPQFVLAPREDGTDGLELRNFPVPEKRRIADEPADPTAAASQSSGLGRLLWHARKKLSAARKLCAFGIRKRVIYPLLSRLGWDPFPLLGQLGYDIYPEYQAADTEEWRLMAAILRRFAQGKGQKPFVVAPLVDSLYTRFAVGRSYWERFSSLADGERVHVIDLLPHFLKLGRQAPRCFLEPHDSHLSDFGHSVLADAVESELRRLDILPIGNFESHGAGADKQTTIQNRG
ncbi:MAG: hypothetical protein EXS05_13920 [Planctomycetaceae bacterium]|nr:hypothetical protein [Planctomycetaceae bacterium]